MTSKTSQQPFYPRKTNQNDLQIRIHELSKRGNLRGEKGRKGEEKELKIAANIQRSSARN
jgi:hypothetical protein